MPYRNAANLNIRFPDTDGLIVWVWVIVSSSDKGDREERGETDRIKYPPAAVGLQ